MTHGQHESRSLMLSIIQRIATGPELSKDISYEEATAGMRAILEGEIDPVQAGIFLIALRMKRETDDEAKGVLQAIREATTRVEAPVDELLDIVDPYDGFNRHILVSAFLPAVLAACGIPAVSHGVDAMGPKYGVTHARVLGAAGARVDRAPREVATALGQPEICWGYLDQRIFCPALHDLLTLRDQIVKRPVITTAEVLAGPVKARVKTHLMTGYVHKPYPRIYALLARHAGFSSALLVRGVEGGITPSLKQKGKVWFYRGGGDETALDLEPGDLGIERSVRAVPLPDDLSGYRKAQEDEVLDVAGIAAAAAAAGRDALNGEEGPAFDSLVYAGALGLYHLKRVANLNDGGRQVRAALISGKARAHFEAGC